MNKSLYTDRQERVNKNSQKLGGLALEYLIHEHGKPRSVRSFFDNHLSLSAFMPINICIKPKGLGREAAMLG